MAGHDPPYEVNVRVYAISLKSSEKAVRKAAGVEPVHDAPGDIGPVDVLYVDLHGEPGGTALYDDPSPGSGHALAVLTEADVLRMDLRGAVVFCTACYLGDPSTSSGQAPPMREAFFRAGARAVVAGDGVNYTASGRFPYGANVLGRWFVFFAQFGRSPKQTLQFAKIACRASLARLMGSEKVRRAMADTDAFRVFEPVRVET